MKVLVTGGTGFVGRNLVKALQEEYIDVRMLVRKTSNIDGFRNRGIELFYGDITQRETLHGIAKGISVVYHLAAMGHVSAISKAAYERFFEVNVRGTDNLAGECCNNGIKRFIHFSSTAAMGLIKMPLVDETVPCQPSTPYQKSKFLSEETAMKYWNERRLPVIILRPCMIYGRGGTGEFLKICKLIKRGSFPRIGRGKNLTPIVHVEDVVQSALLAGYRGIPGETYLITSSESYELDEIRRLIAQYLGANGIYPYVPYTIAKAGAHMLEIMARLLKSTPLVTSKNIESTVTDRVFDISKATMGLGYMPQKDLACGIKETISWYEDNGYL